MFIISYLFIAIVLIFFNCLGPIISPAKEIIITISLILMIITLLKKKIYYRSLIVIISSLLIFSPYIFFYKIPAVRLFLCKISLIISSMIPTFYNNIMFGQDILGLPIIVITISLIISTKIYSKSITWILIFKLLILTILLFSLNISLFSYLPFERNSKMSFLNNIISFQPLFLLLLMMIPVFIMTKNIEIKPTKQLYKRFLFILILSSILNSFLFYYMNICYNFDSKNSAGKVIFLKKNGILNFDSPQRNKYGTLNVGMFGELVKYLKYVGYSVEIKDNITEPDLKACNVLVTINLTEEIKEKEYSQIWKFVDDGGSLLVLGDHTDVGGTASAINKLLKPTDISYNFDSVLPTKTHWDNCLMILAHPITKGIKESIQISMSVGASLKIEEYSIPILVGKYSYADVGNPKNEKNAYLGNYKYDKGEQYGDNILAVENKFGKGKVLVFGDTSSFQTSSLIHSRAFIDNIFTYLTGFKPNKIDDKNQTALIDISHNENLNIITGNDDSAYATALSIIRKERFVYFAEELKDINKSSLFVIIAPTKNFSEKEINIIHSYINNGGDVIISVGYEEYQYSQELLSSFGVKLKDVPMGPVDLKYKNINIQFVSAWPMEINNKDAEILIEKWNYPIVCSIKEGSGRVFIISDSKFLLSGNLETKDFFYEGNIKFVENILDMIWETKEENKGIEIKK